MSGRPPKGPAIAAVRSFGSCSSAVIFADGRCKRWPGNSSSATLPSAHSGSMPRSDVIAYARRGVIRNLNAGPAPPLEAATLVAPSAPDYAVPCSSNAG
jgi:hypothetical protein